MRTSPCSLAGRTVLLTGAAGAVGKAAAAAFSREGAKVLGVDRDKDGLVELIASGALADGQAGDLTDPEFVDQVVADQPAVDVLVNNDHVLETDPRNAARLCGAYAPGMATRRRGKVITVSSAGALLGFTRSVALEYAARGVQCNVLAPAGGVDSPDAFTGPLLFLASAMSDHVTGQVLVVDDGYSEGAWS
jgi:2-keto-3-deoxy-L-fuconate dehydrogenase